MKKPDYPGGLRANWRRVASAHAICFPAPTKAIKRSYVETRSPRAWGTLFSLSIRADDHTARAFFVQTIKFVERDVGKMWQASHTPDSVQSVICLGESFDPPAAITLQSVTLRRHRRCDGNQPAYASQSHPPCSQLDIHPAAAVSCDAGRLLPYRFSHRPHPTLPRKTGEGKMGAGLLSVAVVVTISPLRES